MRLSIALLLGFFTLAAAGFGAYVWHWENRPHVLEIYCFALDKSGASPGNLAVFIRTPDNRTILIDGGKSGSVIAALTSVMPFYRRTIDTVISTNPDDSHVTGLAGVIGRYHIGQAIESAAVSVATGSAYVAFEKGIESQKIRHVEVSPGDMVDSGDPALSVEILFPASSSDFQFSKTNQPVLAFLIRYGSTSVLFGGDITKKEQEYLSQKISSSSFSFSLSHILLILPHAENAGASDEEFFTALNPETVVVLKKAVSSGRASKSAIGKEPKKPKKPPFDISAVSNLSIVNLTISGDTEFISDGKSFARKNLK